MADAKQALEDLALLVQLCDRMADEGKGSMYHPDTLAQRNAVVRRLREFISPSGVEGPELAEIKPPITTNCRHCESPEACRTAGCGRAQWMDENWFRNQPAGAPGVKARDPAPGVDLPDRAKR